MNLYEELLWRGLINQVTDDNLKNELENSITLYCGIDPTGESMHVGHLVPTIVLKHFQNHGHDIIWVVGGSTALIGDPSGKNEERKLQDEKTIQEFTKQIEQQLKKYFVVEKTRFVNNYDWTVEYSIFDFLREVGKNFPINYLLNKDIISSRLETGITYTEFSYTILQALDFEYLYRTYNCQLQIGGSDQWGNITSGLEYIRRKHGDVDCFGLTLPLVTKSDGTKFGKTAGGAIWLDAEKTSPYEFYQFFLNTEDSDVIKYLKMFTFESVERIKQLEQEVENNPAKREAQKALAASVTSFVHGEEALNQVLKISAALFTGDITKLTAEEIEKYFTHIDMYEIPVDTLVIDALITTGLAKSRRESREFINNNSIAVNGNKISDIDLVLTETLAIEQKYILLKRGKKKYAIVSLGGKNEN